MLSTAQGVARLQEDGFRKSVPLGCNSALVELNHGKHVRRTHDN